MPLRESETSDLSEDNDGNIFDIIDSVSIESSTSSPMNLTLDQLLQENVKPIPEEMPEIQTFVPELEIDDDIGEFDSTDMTRQKTSRLSCNEIEQRMREILPKLKDIYNGKTFCKRHQDFKSDSLKRAMLNMKITLDFFTTDQMNVISDVLVKTFSPKGKLKYFDYTMKVLVPEAMTILVASELLCSVQEADYLVSGGVE